MSSESGTPRTDALESAMEKFSDGCPDYTEDEKLSESLNHARAIERENAALREQLDSAYVTAGTLKVDLVKADWKANKAEQRAREAEKDALQKCWNSIDRLIIHGDVPGNGTDLHSQRNGLVIAANTINELIAALDAEGKAT